MTIHERKVYVFRNELTYVLVNHMLFIIDRMDHPDHDGLDVDTATEQEIMGICFRAIQVTNENQYQGFLAVLDLENLRD